MFDHLGVEVGEHQAILTEPQGLTGRERARMTEIMIENIGLS